MIKEIKELRVTIDGLAQLTEDLKPINNGKGLTTPLPNINSKEINEAVDSLYLAKAWLGKILGELGNENPYKSEYKTKEDIESTADTKELNAYELALSHCGETAHKRPTQEELHIQKVDWLRTEISKISYTVLELNSGKLSKRASSEYEEKLQWSAYQHLCQARFYLGFELARIRENE